MSIRCFIAIELDHSIARMLRRFQEHLRTRYNMYQKGIKWVNPENIHLTLKFLGEVDDKLIPPICRVVTQASEQFTPFELEIADCGCFPPHGAARVIWAGVNDYASILEKLQVELEDGLCDLGFARENRKFSPHLTLARIKNSRAGREVSDIADKLPNEIFGIQEVSSITVFQSELDRTGPTYTPLHHAKLSNSMDK